MSGVLFFRSGISVMAGVAIPVYQTFLWLREGRWTALSVLDALKYVDTNPERPYQWTWLYFPQDWIGFYKLLENTPLSLILVLLAVPFFWLATLALEKEEEIKEREERRRQEKEKKGRNSNLYL